MKILLANSFFYRRGGADAHFLDLVTALPRFGHEVAAFSMQHPENLVSPWERFWPTYVEFRGRLSTRNRARALCRSTYSFDAASALEGLLESFRPDVAHLHGIHHHLTLSTVDVLARHGIPTVWTLHDYRTVCPASAMLRWGKPCHLCAGGHYWHAVPGRCKSGEVSRSAAAALEAYLMRYRRTLARVACFIAPSNFLASMVRRMGFLAWRLEVLPNHIEVDSTLEWDGGDEFLFVGRLSPEKGLRGLIGALSHVGSARLVVVGDGPESARIQAEACGLGVDVSFKGWLAREDVLEYMRQSRALLFPSICYENCPIVVLEAMALGLPVIGSDLGGVPELLDHGRCGTLVAAGDTPQWIAVLEEAAASVEHLRAPAELGRTRIAERHGSEGFYQRLGEIYASVVGDAAHPLS